MEHSEEMLKVQFIRISDHVGKRKGFGEGARNTHGLISYTVSGAVRLRHISKNWTTVFQ